MKKLLIALLAGMTVIASTPAMARDHYRGYDRYERDYRGHRGTRYTDRRYQQPYRQGYYRHDGRYQRCRDKGNGGLVLGAIAGGLLGRTIDRDGDRTLGTVGGAVVGGALGRAVDRDCR